MAGQRRARQSTCNYNTEGKWATAPYLKLTHPYPILHCHKNSTGARYIYDKCTGNQVPVFYRNIYGTFFPVHVHLTIGCCISLRKHAYSKYIENLTTKKGKFSEKNSYLFHISDQNIDCGYSLEPPRWGGSNEYPQSIFFSKIRKIMYTPVNPSFTI